MLNPQDLLHWDLVPVAGVLIVVLVLLVSLLNESPKNALRYHGRFVVYVATVSFTAIGCIPLFCLNPMNVKNCLYISSVLKHVTKLLGITWELRNGEILAEDRGGVIVANHQSTLDILGMFNIWNVMDKCAAIARKEVFYVWPFGLAAWLGGVVFIDRSNRAKALETLNHASKLTNAQKTKLWLFPEGTRNRSGKGLLSFKKGAFRVAIECQVPILPVVFSPYYFINPKTKYFGTGNIIIQALPAIPTVGMTLDDVDALMEKTRNLMLETVEALAKEVYSKLPPNYPGLVPT